MSEDCVGQHSPELEPQITSLVNNNDAVSITILIMSHNNSKHSNKSKHIINNPEDRVGQHAAERVDVGRRVRFVGRA